MTKQWIIVKNDELCHQGIKGQKWGVRRYQNEDRTWTAAGKERYYTPVGDRKRAVNSTSKKVSTVAKQAGRSVEPEKKKSGTGKKIAKALAITAGVAGAGAAAYVVGKKVNAGLGNATSLLENEQRYERLVQTAKNRLEDLSARGASEKEINAAKETLSRNETYLKTAKDLISKSRKEGSEDKKYFDAIDKAKQVSEKVDKITRTSKDTKTALNLQETMSRYDRVLDGQNIYNKDRQASMQNMRRQMQNNYDDLMRNDKVATRVAKINRAEQKRQDAYNRSFRKAMSDAKNAVSIENDIKSNEKRLGNIPAKFAYARGNISNEMARQRSTVDGIISDPKVNSLVSAYHKHNDSWALAIVDDGARRVKKLLAA